MQENAMNNIIIKLEDITVPIKAYRNYLESKGITFESIEADNAAKIKENKSLTDDERSKALESIKGVYAFREKLIVKQFLLKFFNNEIILQQIVVDDIFNWVEHSFKLVEKELDIEFSDADRAEVAFEVIGAYESLMSKLNTSNYADTERKLIEEYQARAEKTLKANKDIREKTERIEKLIQRPIESPEEE